MTQHIYHRFEPHATDEHYCLLIPDYTDVIFIQRTGQELTYRVNKYSLNFKNAFSIDDTNEKLFDLANNQHLGSELMTTFFDIRDQVPENYKSCLEKLAVLMWQCEYEGTEQLKIKVVPSYTYA